MARAASTIPYFAAYNCGACSGRSGAPNARAFAKAANRPDVRALLAARGLAIPDSTWFVGALYDTTRDEATYYDYDVARMPARFAEPFAALRRTMEEVAARNAAERCRRFDTRAARARARRRRSTRCGAARSRCSSRAPSTTTRPTRRCIVGRRALTAGLFLDRRAFLTSYDPTRIRRARSWSPCSPR